MFRNLSVLGALVLTVAGASAARASIIAEDSFSYGGTAGALNGNGGTGFSAAWSAPGSSPWTYTPTGLTLGSLSTSGGAAVGGRVSGSVITGATREFNAALSGTIYGAYLFKVTEGPLTGTTTFGLGPSFITNPASTLAVKGVASPSGLGQVQLEASPSFMTGTPVVVGETLLALFKFDTVAKTADAWFLNASQYDNFITSGLMEASLNSATLGSAATDVLQRGSTSTAATLGALVNLNLLVQNFLPLEMDEIRLSDASLAEAAPRGLGVPSPVVPEPASVLAWLGVAVIAGPVAAYAKRRRAAVG